VSEFDDWDADRGTEQPGQVADPLSRQARLTAWVRGRVQGVGFRWWVRSLGLELGLLGVAENLVDGRVKIVVEGNRDSCAALLERLEAPGAPGHVIQVTYRWDQARGGLAGFVER
jgi:acylphosphatase